MFPVISIKYREKPEKMEGISEANDSTTIDSRDKTGVQPPLSRSVTSRALCSRVASRALCRSVASRALCRRVTSQTLCGNVRSHTVHQMTSWTAASPSGNNQVPVLISPRKMPQLRTGNCVRFVSPSHVETTRLKPFIDPFQGAKIRLVVAAKHNDLQDEYYELKQGLIDCLQRHNTGIDFSVHTELHSGIDYFKKYIDTINKDGQLKPIPCKETSFISKGSVVTGSTKGSRTRFKLEYQRVKAEDLRQISTYS